MSGPSPALDPAIAEVLTRAARSAGEDVGVYIGRAVAARLAADLFGSDDPDLAATVTTLRRDGLAVGLDGDGEALVSLFRDGHPTSTPPHTATDPIIRDPERLRALLATGLMDTQPGAAYDRIAQMAVDALNVPSAGVSLVSDEKQWFCSAAGISGELAETRTVSLDRSLCQYAVSSGTPLVIEDARVHPTLSSHPIVADGTVVAYAGIPLTDADGHAIGTLCAWDAKPRQWTSGHVQILEDLATVVRERIFGDLGVGRLP
ncbi:GAF domain-containing protein [Williamsia sp.]|uniref:GAF domain-containing protein n=1 Tax=Williamsia sp. TaxID=1872085 RepID=UPI001A2E921C|nr:GAF domain-containing protein [Williamsia sp.]MBJ7288656.1 GAF domain-containing protein [Williamsia sp.]